MLKLDLKLFYFSLFTWYTLLENKKKYISIKLLNETKILIDQF